MPFDELLKFYNGLLYSIIMCYIIYRLNTDQKTMTGIKYACSSLVISVVIYILNVFATDIHIVVRTIALILCIIFSMFLFNRYSIFHSAITAFLGLFLLGISELFVTIAYLFPLKLSLDEFSGSFIHFTIGEVLAFLFVYFILKLIAGTFIRVRRRIHKKYKRLTLLLCANITSGFVVLMFVFSLLDYYFDFKSTAGRGHSAYINIVLITVVLIASIVGTIYLINHLIINRIEYDRLKMNNIMDGMTDTLNRVSGLKFIEEQLELCKKSSKDLTICYIDVNDLKLVNDMLGHSEGDQMIKTIVSAIKENIRETDAISRLGGDEFVVIFPGCTKDYAEKVLNRISEKLRHLKPFRTDEEYTISISFGFSEFSGDCAATVETLLDKADKQMYLNKKAIKSLA